MNALILNGYGPVLLMYVNIAALTINMVSMNIPANIAPTVPSTGLGEGPSLAIVMVVVWVLRTAPPQGRTKPTRRNIFRELGITCKVYGYLVPML